jgi:HAD superfamily hydrolase (TIGR01509 family)
MAHHPKALLLDFDGTLADSLGAMWDAYCAFAKNVGIIPARVEFDGLNGPPLAEIVTILRQRHALSITQDAAMHAYNHAIATALPQARPTHGAQALLQEARTQGWRVGIVTSTERARVARWLDQLGLAAWVETVVGNEILAGKPDPAPYRAALHRLDCAAGDSIALEDSAPGYASAKAAGLQALFYRPFNRALGPAHAECVESLPAVRPLLAGRTRSTGLRLATEADRAFLFALRNDLSAVRYFRTPRTLSLEELEARFRDDPTLREKITLIGETMDESAAMIRFDRRNPDYLVSIAVHEAFRGKGLGVNFLGSAIDALLAMLGPTPILAEVAEDNAASVRLFEGCGFRQEGLDGRFRRYRRDAAPFPAMLPP